MNRGVRQNFLPERLLFKEFGRSQHDGSVQSAACLNPECNLTHFKEVGRLELIEGYVEVRDSEDHQSIVQVDRNGEQTIHRYKMFVDGSGQQVLDIDEYPFISLVESGSVRAARVRFANSLAVADRDDETRKRLIDQRGGAAIRLDGIDIDESFRVIGVDGEPNPRIYEMSFPHTAGKRPYSYGLQACNDTARIVVASLLNAKPETSRCKEAE